MGIGRSARRVGVGAQDRRDDRFVFLERTGESFGEMKLRTPERREPHPRLGHQLADMLIVRAEIEQAVEADVVNRIGLLGALLHQSKRSAVLGFEARSFADRHARRREPCADGL